MHSSDSCSIFHLGSSPANIMPCSQPADERSVGLRDIAVSQRLDSLIASKIRQRQETFPPDDCTMSRRDQKETRFKCLFSRSFQKSKTQTSGLSQFL